jgi:hypothetical protein
MGTTVMKRSDWPRYTFVWHVNVEVNNLERVDVTRRSVSLLKRLYEGRAIPVRWHMTLVMISEPRPGKLCLT